jgi:hypothetical protein
MLAGIPPHEHWPSVSDSLLEAKERELFQKKCNAVRMYVEGSLVTEIQRLTGISRSSFGSLTSKCLEVASDGKIMGYRALLPYAHQKEYCRVAEIKHKLPESQGGMSGVFRQTLNKFPEIEEKLIQLIKKNNSPELNVHEKKIRAKTLHKIFLDTLKKRGVRMDQWPFNTKHMALKTIQKYLDEKLNESFGRTVSTREEQVAIAHMAVSTGYERFLSFEEPYDVVQLDAYNINAFFTAEFETPEGTTTDVQLERIWLIAMIEPVSSAILAYSIIYRSEVSADDVIGVLRKAVNPPVRLELSIPGLVYPVNGGVPSEVFPQCQGAIWGALLLDGALAHLANAVHSRARKSLGFAINWGPVGHFERRPDIERYFGTISKDVFMRLPSTTGSNPQKGRAKDAEQNAVKYKIRADEAEQLVAVFSAQHNATPSEGNSFNSPLEVLRYYVEKRADHFLLRHLPIKSGSTSTLIPLILICTVRGGRASGRRPYVQIDGVRYTSPVLSQAPGLIGKKLIIEVDEDDMRLCKAYLENGGELGILKAGGRWYLTKHSRKTRKIINSLITKKILVISEHDDPVQVYLNFVSQHNKSRKSKGKLLNPSQATEANRISKESGLQRKIVPSHEVKHTNEITLSELQETRPSMMSKPMPDLNQLIKKKS